MSLEQEITMMNIEALNLEDVSLDDIDVALNYLQEGLFIDSVDAPEARVMPLKQEQIIWHLLMN